jgi:acyl phosphate:glycerol-3-phosphate acyltransferase
MAYLPYIAASVVGYILGSVPNGYLVARAHGVNIFKEGSGNPGATNVKRVLGEKFGDKGRRAGNWVFVLDAVKGALAAGWPLVCCGLPYCAITPDTASQLGLIGVVAAVIGHSFSVFTKFKGGKGVATAVGGLIVMIPVPCVIGFAVWIASFYLTRYVSLGSILGAVVVPTASWIQGNPLPINIVTSALGLFVIYRHRENIKRLLNGTENRFVKKTGAPGEAKKPGA